MAQKKTGCIVIIQKKEVRNANDKNDNQHEGFPKMDEGTPKKKS